jgi:MFS family permease
MRKNTFPLMASVLISNILYTNLHSFYPLYIQSNFPELQSTHFGIILATFEIANIITSLFLGIYVSKLRRKTLIIWSYFILFLGTLSFTSLSFLEP